MSQFKRGFGIAGQSWRTLRSHRSLAAFPILGGAMALVAVAPPALAGAYLADRGDTVPGAVLGAVLFAGASVLSNALRQIFAVALFRFTTSGEPIGGFDSADLEHAVRVKGRPAVA